MRHRLIFLLLASALRASSATAAMLPPPSPPGEVHLGRLGVDCDSGTLPDGRRYDEYRLSGLRGQTWGLVVTGSEDFYPVLQVLDPSREQPLLLEIKVEASETPAVALFTADKGDNASGDYVSHHYKLRIVQQHPADHGIYKIEANYDGVLRELDTTDIAAVLEKLERYQSCEKCAVPPRVSTSSDLNNQGAASCS